MLKVGHWSMYTHNYIISATSFAMIFLRNFIINQSCDKNHLDCYSSDYFQFWIKIIDSLSIMDSFLVDY